MRAPASPQTIPFNSPDVGEAEIAYMLASVRSGKIAGDGAFTYRCHEFLERIYGFTTLLVHSGTAALEMAAHLIDLQPGDEVLMPSFGFVSAANAVALRGAVPVFVDIRLDTLNIDENQIKSAITEKTRAIMPVHYGGVAAEMSAINAIADQHGIPVIEDAAQGFGATYKGSPLGAIGQLGCLSFHETKNVTAGEGGAIIVKDPQLAKRAQHIREKGTNRTDFRRGDIKKYEWIDIGSSYLPSDILAAMPLAQLERADTITARRIEIWKRYEQAFLPLKDAGLILPTIPPECGANAHIFYLRMPTQQKRDAVIAQLAECGIQATSHYVPMHSAPAAPRFSRWAGSLENTDLASSTLLRLPLSSTLSDAKVEYVCSHAFRIAEGLLASASHSK